MLFHVVNERHRRHRPMIFTTNKSLKAWGRVLHDEDLAHAIIDRVLERGRLLRLDGPSVRTLHVNLDDAMKEDSDQAADLVRISGKSRSEFPEPTPAPNAIVESVPVLPSAPISTLRKLPKNQRYAPALNANIMLWASSSRWYVDPTCDYLFYRSGEWRAAVTGRRPVGSHPPGS
jgi:hypothetical protein